MFHLSGSPHHVAPIISTYLTFLHPPTLLTHRTSKPGPQREIQRQSAAKSRPRPIMWCHRGTSGFVQLAYNMETGERVAIKFIHREPDVSHNVTRELLNHRLCALHPHIIQLKVCPRSGPGSACQQRSIVLPQDSKGRSLLSKSKEKASASSVSHSRIVTAQKSHKSPFGGHPASLLKEGTFCLG